jgi:hypothetical protein
MRWLIAGWLTIGGTAFRQPRSARFYATLLTSLAAVYTLTDWDVTA